MKTKTFRLGALALAAILAVSTPIHAQAHDAHHHGTMSQDAMASKGITVTVAWARPTIAKQRVTAAYFEAAAKGEDRLIAARTPVAAHAELHEHVMEGDIARMRPVAAVPIAPGEPVRFAPGGYHVMIMDLKKPLKEGDTFPLTLIFEKAGDVTVEVSVVKTGAAMGHGGGHKH